MCLVTRASSNYVAFCSARHPHSDFADQFPNAKVTGTDISPIQPYWTPPNLQFEIDDATLEWTYRPGTFDYVHMRYLLGAIIDWNELFRQAHRSLKPGGWLESYEASVVEDSDDGSVEPGSPMDQWGKLFHEAGRKTGRSFRVYEDNLQKKAMEAVGFVDIHVWEFKVRQLSGPSVELPRRCAQFPHRLLSKETNGRLA